MSKFARFQFECIKVALRYWADRAHSAVYSHYGPNDLAGLLRVRLSNYVGDMRMNGPARRKRLDDIHNQEASNVFCHGTDYAPDPSRVKPRLGMNGPTTAIRAGYGKCNLPFALGGSFVWGSLYESKPSYQTNPSKPEGEHVVAHEPGRPSVASKQPHGGDQEGKWYKTFLDHTPDWFVAIFTALLTFVTYRLVLSTNRLWDAGERQMGLMAHNTSQQREIGQAQVRSYVSVKSAAIYFGGDDDPMPFIEIVAVNSGQSPALGFIWAPEVRYLADVEADIVSDPGDAWTEQPGRDVASGVEVTQMYVPTSFNLFTAIRQHRPDIPDKVGVSVIVHFAWVDVFGNQLGDMASFAGVAEAFKANKTKRHPLNTSAWACHILHPIEKGKVWTGIAVQAPPSGRGKPRKKQPDDAPRSEGRAGDREA